MKIGRGGWYILDSLRWSSTSFCLSRSALRCRTLLSPQGVLKPSSAMRQMLSFLFIFPFITSLFLSISFRIILSPELPREVAENVTTKEREKMIREGKEGHLQFTSRRRQKEVKRKQRMKAMRSEEEKKRGVTEEERINNLNIRITASQNLKYKTVGHSLICVPASFPANVNQSHPS